MSSRPAALNDLSLIAQWIERDPYHQGMDPQFFVIPEPHTNCLIWEDEDGPSFAFRLSRLLRLDVQFDGNPERTMKSMSDCFLWLRATAIESGFRELIFQSVHRPLINFCKRRFQFAEAKDELICLLPMETIFTADNGHKKVS